MTVELQPNVPATAMEGDGEAGIQYGQSTKPSALLIQMPKDVLISVCSFCDAAELGHLRRLTKMRTCLAEAASEDVVWQPYWNLLTQDDFFSMLCGRKYGTKGSLDCCLAAHSRYLQFASRTQSPTVEQAVDFVNYVASARSWYDKISVAVPSFSIQFMATPVAGMRRAADRDGGYSFIDFRNGDGTESQYAWQPTERYRQRFGFLAYDCTPIGSTHKTTKSVADDMVALPLSMVSGRCSVPVTACMHPLAASYHMYSSAWKAALNSSDGIPSESDFQSMAWPSLDETCAKLRAHGITELNSHWIGMTDVVERVRNSFATMVRHYYRQPCEKANRREEIEKLVDDLFANDVSFASPRERRVFISEFVDFLRIGKKIQWGENYALKGPDATEIDPSQLLLCVERAKQWWSMGSAVQSCVRGTWGKAASGALQELPARSALRSLGGKLKNDEKRGFR